MFHTLLLCFSFLFFFFFFFFFFFKLTFADNEEMFLVALFLSVATARVDVYMYDVVVSNTNFIEFNSSGTLNINGLTSSGPIGFSGNVGSLRNLAAGFLYLGGDTPANQALSYTVPAGVNFVLGNSGFAGGACCPSGNWLGLRTRTASSPPGPTGAIVIPSTFISGNSLTNFGRFNGHLVSEGFFLGTYTVTLPNDVLVYHIGVNPNGRICRPSADLTAPCGPAFQDWLSRGGFAQVSNTAAIYTNASVSGVPFCGSSPVRSTFSFSSNTNGALGTGTFTTADGSCTCDYCYPLEDFDLSSMLPMCFSQSSSGFGITQQIFNSAPNSVGLNITTSSAPVSQSLTSGEFLLFKKQVKFWIRTELVSGESVSVSIVQNSITYVVPAAALVGSCSFNNAANTAWILQNRCTVIINLCLVPGVNPIVALQLRFSYSPPMTKRVDAVITTPPALPLRGFWIDTIQACGTNTC